VWNTLGQTNQFQERVTPIHVLVANLPSVLSELVVQAFQGRFDIVVEGQVQGQIELLLAIKNTTDILILGVEALDPPPGICSHVLTEYPFLKILAIQIGSDDWAVYWLALHERQLHQLSMATLADGVRWAYHLDIT
jgi:hypothetical protein